MCLGSSLGCSQRHKSHHHTSQTARFRFELSSEPRASSPARGVSVAMGEGPRSWRPVAGNGNQLGPGIWSHQGHEMGSGSGLVQQGGWRS